MSSDLFLSDLKTDPRIQLYRTAMDDLLSWLGLVSNALSRNLFNVADIKEVGYWVVRIEKLRYMDPFIFAFGYKQQTDHLRLAFESFAGNYLHTALKETDADTEKR